MMCVRVCMIIRIDNLNINSSTRFYNTKPIILNLHTVYGDKLFLTLSLIVHNNIIMFTVLCPYITANSYCSL